MDAAIEYFGISALHEEYRTDALLAVNALLAKAGCQDDPSAPPCSAGQYDYIIHDVFSGTGIPVTLLSPRFFGQLSSLLRPGGVIAVNVFGETG